MIDRPFWRARIESAWKRASVVWLTGVRRVGKTTLARAFPQARYVNCDLPSSAVMLQEPERFLASVSHSILVLDEVHQLSDPSRVLKIAADEFPKLRVLATGSSTLAATSKFRDSLAGRKREVLLLPVLVDELAAFGVKDLRHRLFRGGLPQALLADEPDPVLYAEWLDSFYARDVQELFRVEKRRGFLLLLETLLRQSGGLMEVSSLAKACGLSRPTVMNYVEVLRVTHAIRVLRPFHGGSRRELLQQPKAYAFDTGFVAYARGWSDLRDDDCGTLWEHLVLDLIYSIEKPTAVHFWRDKQQREIDFVIARGRGECDAIECKWRASAFDPKALLAFRALHRRGKNLVVSPSVEESYVRSIAGLDVQFLNALSLRRLLH